MTKIYYPDKILKPEILKDIKSCDDKKLQRYSKDAKLRSYLYVLYYLIVQRSLKFYEKMNQDKQHKFRLIKRFCEDLVFLDKKEYFLAYKNPIKYLEKNNYIIEQANNNPYSSLFSKINPDFYKCFFIEKFETIDKENISFVDPSIYECYSEW